MGRSEAIDHSPIVIAGGSGFLGLSPTYLAAAGRAVVILSRSAPRVPGRWQHVTWDARALGSWSDALDGAAAMVNLVGRSVDCVKTPDHQAEILRPPAGPSVRPPPSS